MRGLNQAVRVWPALVLLPRQQQKGRVMHVVRMRRENSVMKLGDGVLNLINALLLRNDCPKDAAL